MSKYYGKLIARTIRERGHSFHSIAKYLNIDKQTVQSWLQEPIPSIDSIRQIGKVIVHDFEVDLPEIFAKKIIAPVQEPAETTGNESQKAFIREKYISLLENYNAHLLKIIDHCREEYGESCCRTT